MSLTDGMRNSWSATDNPVKKMAMEIFASTFTHPERLHVRVLTVGETAAVLDLLDYDFMLALRKTSKA